MNTNANPRSATCQRCGESTSSFSPQLKSIMLLQRTPREEQVSKLAELEAIPPEMAAENVAYTCSDSSEMRTDLPRFPPPGSAGAPRVMGPVGGEALFRP